MGIPSARREQECYHHCTWGGSQVLSPSVPTSSQTLDKQFVIKRMSSNVGSIIISGDGSLREEGWRNTSPFRFHLPLCEETIPGPCGGMMGS